MSNSTRCAACKCLRRRCGEDCVLAPYFPSTHPHRFACVHRIFGAGNASRMLQQLPAYQRSEAADAISAEACCRVLNPVYGSTGVISALQQDIRVAQRELAQTRAQIAMHRAQQQLPDETTYFVAQPSDQFTLDKPIHGFFCQPPSYP